MSSNSNRPKSSESEPQLVQGDLFEDFLPLVAQRTNTALSSDQKEDSQGEKEETSLSQAEPGNETSLTDAQILTRLHVSPSDIPYSTALAAHTGTSFYPEKRAQQEIDSYVGSILVVARSFLEHAKTEEEQAFLWEELERYAQRHLGYRLAWLQSRHGLVSNLTAGYSNFPVSRMKKKNRTIDRRFSEMMEHQEKAQGSIRKKLARHRQQKKIDAAGGMINFTQVELQEAIEYQEMMKKANRIIRGKKLSLDEKLSQLLELGIKESIARKLFEPDFAGRIGFADYQLTNNNARIRRLRAKVNEETAKENRTTSEIQYEGLKLIHNADVDRIQLVFDGKPDEDTRALLKSNGFRWAPSQGAWQRQLTSNGIDAANRFLKQADISPQAEV